LDAVASKRRTILVGLGLTIAAIAAFILSRVIMTILVAIAASYMLLPAHKWTIRHGIPSYWSAILVTLAGVVASLTLIVPFVFVLYVRRDALLDGIAALDTSIPVPFGSETVILNLTPLQEVLTPNVSRVAVVAAQQASIYSMKFVVYAFVVFALLYYYDRLRSLVFGPVPAMYHDIIDRVHTRIREVLFGHYVLVLAGGVVTYATGLGVFLLLDYQLPFILALVGAVLWTLPFISAAPLVVGLAAFHLLEGELLMVVAITTLGAVFLVALPNLIVDVVRFRLGDPKRLSQTLYFVGFVGGGLTIGVVGFIIGPIVLAIVVALTNLLAEGSYSDPVGGHSE
jgi:predicted PurR-regulated permease PerM